MGYNTERLTVSKSSAHRKCTGGMRASRLFKVRSSNALIELNIPTTCLVSPQMVPVFEHPATRRTSMLCRFVACRVHSPDARCRVGSDLWDFPEGLKPPYRRKRRWHVMAICLIRNMSRHSSRTMKRRPSKFLETIQNAKGLQAWRSSGYSAILSWQSSIPTYATAVASLRNASGPMSLLPFERYERSRLMSYEVVRQKHSSSRPSPQSDLPSTIWKSTSVVEHVLYVYAVTQTRNSNR